MKEFEILLSPYNKDSVIFVMKFPDHYGAELWVKLTYPGVQYHIMEVTGGS